MAASGKRTMINVACSLVTLAVNMCISFLLSPYIVQNIGVEANGFVNLANNCVTYAQLIVTALNGMASRFITIEYVRGDVHKANLFYNSVFWGNIVIVTVLFVPAVYCVAKLEAIFDVPPDILFDVKWLFALVFFNFFISTALPNWDCGTFVSNRLDRSYLAQLTGSFTRCVVLFAMFSLFTPHVWFVGVAATALTIVTLAANAVNTHRLTPELRIILPNGRPYCSGKIIRELVSSGIWGTISSLGNILESGLDLVVCNMVLGATQMGVLSVSKTVISLVQQMGFSVCRAFLPELTIDFAEGNKVAILRNIRRAMAITGTLVAIPLGCLFVYGDTFYMLWVPSQDARLLQLLSILGSLGSIFTGGILVLYNVFTVTNHVKENSLVVIASGVVSIIITLISVLFFDGGLCAVAMVSSIVSLVGNIAFTVPMSAVYLGLSWTSFFPSVGRSALQTAGIIITGVGLKALLPVSTWAGFFGSVILLSCLGLALSFFVVFSKDERSYVAALISKILGRMRCREKTL